MKPLNFLLLIRCQHIGIISESVITIATQRTLILSWTNEQICDHYYDLQCSMSQNMSNGARLRLSLKGVPSNN